MALIFGLNFLVIFRLICPILAQYAIHFETHEDCSVKKVSAIDYETYFDTVQLKCLTCAQDSSFQKTRGDGLGCMCSPGHRLTEDRGGDIRCEKCQDNEVVSPDGWECLWCDQGSGCRIGKSCSNKNQISAERYYNGSWITGAPERGCLSCSFDTQPNHEKTRCERCDQILSVLFGNISCKCPPNRQTGGLCFRDSGDLQPSSVFMHQVTFEHETFTSQYLSENLDAVVAMCSDRYGNRTACQHLANMCVLILYRKGFYLADSACTVYLERAERSKAVKRAVGDVLLVLPQIYYPIIGAQSILDDTSISDQFRFDMDRLDLVASMYSANGTFLGFRPVAGGLLQFCKATPNMLDAGFEFGVHYRQKCEISVRRLWDRQLNPTIFYELWLRSKVDGESELHEVPILITDYISPTGFSSNMGINPSEWQLFKRFFMVDNISGARDGTASDVGVDVVRYAKSISITVSLQRDLGYNGGLIYPPYVRVNYTTANMEQYEANDNVTVQFEVFYRNHRQYAQTVIYAVLGALSVIVFIWSTFQAYSWWRRAGRVIFDATTIVKFLLIFMGALGESIFVVLFVASLWWIACFKLQRKVILFGDNPIGYWDYQCVTIVPFVFQAIHLIHLVVCMVTIDIFFIDWERPSDSLVQRLRCLIPTAPMWRTYFIMRKWNELQTVRRINPAFQMFASVGLLTVLGLGNLATEDPSVDILVSGKTYRAETTTVFRFACFSTVYLIVAMLQAVFWRILDLVSPNRVWQIVDLCSVANISVFVLDTEFSGYYIHGRSICCKADTNLRQMYYNLLREKERANRCRGLRPQKQDQRFEVAVTRVMKLQYDRIILPVLSMPNPGGLVTEELAKRSVKKKEVFVRPETERSVRAYALMNRYLQGFIDHEFLNCDYIIKEKTLAEQILNYEFEKPVNLGFLYADPGWTFHRLFFYGHEKTLLIFEILLFGVINLCLSDYISAGLTVYCISTVVIGTACRAMGRVNVAKKSLVDKRFLI